MALSLETKSTTLILALIAYLPTLSFYDRIFQWRLQTIVFKFSIMMNKSFIIYMKFYMK